MPLQVIDNKKIDLTYDEWNLYNKIVRSYTTPTNNGEDLFKDLFETDDKGVIIFLKPPSNRQTSFEVFLFLVAVCQHQHIRVMYGQVEDIVQQMKDQMNNLNNKIKEIDDKLNKG